MVRIVKIFEDIVKGLPRVASVAPGGNTPPTIIGCKILGFRSKNNRTYTREALTKAAHKYEGVKVNLDHNTGTDPRKFSERFGRMVNVKMAADGLYGDLQYNPKHPLAEAFQWWIKNDPTAIGLSHNATAEVKNTAEGAEIVTEIREVDSVDLVADPATTRGIFESYRMTQVTEDHIGGVFPGYHTPGEAEGYRAFGLGVKENPYKGVADSSNLRPRMGDTTNQLNWQSGWEKARRQMTAPPARIRHDKYGRVNETDDENELEQMGKVLLGNETDERTKTMNEYDEEIPGMAPPDQINSDQEPIPEAENEDENFEAHLGKAIMSIINDTTLSADDKRKKILGALKLMEEDVNEGEPEDAEMMPPADDTMQPIDEDEDMDELSEDDESAQMEDALLNDDAIEEKEPKKAKYAAEAKESVNPKIKDLQKQLEGYKLKEALEIKKAKLLKKCSEAKIPNEAVTPIFVGQLLRLSESTWPKLIADRKFVSQRTVKPTSTSVAVVSESYENFVTDLLNK